MVSKGRKDDWGKRRENVYDVMEEEREREKTWRRQRIPYDIPQTLLRGPRNAIFHDAISCNMISRDIISCDAIFRDVISRDISRDVISRDVISCDVTPLRNVSPPP